MNINECKLKLKDVSREGYVTSLRKGNTGIGYTLETLLGIEENNDSGADIDGSIELKAKRKFSRAKTTNFTQSPIWKRPIRSVVKEYGWPDKDNPERINLYTSLKYRNKSPQGLFVDIEDDNLFIKGKSGEKLAELPLEVLRFRYRKKFPNLILVLADRKKEKNKPERFHYNEAYYCTNIISEQIVKLLKNGKMIVDIRIWMDKNTGKLRDRGMAFRLSSKYTMELFENVECVLPPEVKNENS
tara:strand:- start:321 stop:1049 length:729 start_codon:yes stop_codon:yes gene_type:complete